MRKIVKPKNSKVVKSVSPQMQVKLTKSQENIVNEAFKKTMKEYGETIIKLQDA